METVTEGSAKRPLVRIPAGVGMCLFLVIAAFLLFTEHRAHVLGIVPYALLLLCPLVHLFMNHGDHGKHATHRNPPAGDREGGVS